jgi:hypothetical protein
MDVSCQRGIQLIFDPPLPISEPLDISRIGPFPHPLQTHPDRDEGDVTESHIGVERPRPTEGHAMNGDGFFWLQLAAPLAVLAAGAFVYWFTVRQDRHDATHRGR